MSLQELNFHVQLSGFQGGSAKRPSSQTGVSVFNRCLYQFTTAADKLLHRGQRVALAHHRFTLTGDSLRAERPKTVKKEGNITPP